MLKWRLYVYCETKKLTECVNATERDTEACSLGEKKEKWWNQVHLTLSLQLPRFDADPDSTRNTLYPITLETLKAAIPDNPRDAFCHNWWCLLRYRALTVIKQRASLRCRWCFSECCFSHNFFQIIFLLFSSILRCSALRSIREEFKKARNADISFDITESLKQACTLYKIVANPARRKVSFG